MWVESVHSYILPSPFLAQGSLIFSLGLVGQVGVVWQHGCALLAGPGGEGLLGLALVVLPQRVGMSEGDLVVISVTLRSKAWAGRRVLENMVFIKDFFVGFILYLEGRANGVSGTGGRIGEGRARARSPCQSWPTAASPQPAGAMPGSVVAMLPHP